MLSLTPKGHEVVILILFLRFIF